MAGNALINLGAAYRRFGSLEQAEEAYRQASQVMHQGGAAPDNVWRLHHNYGILFEEDFGDRTGAVEQYVLALSALESAPPTLADWDGAGNWAKDNADVRRRLVHAFVSEGKFDEAVRAIEGGRARYLTWTARELDPPQNPMVPLQLWSRQREIRYRLQQIERAIKFARHQNPSTLGALPNSAQVESLWERLQSIQEEFQGVEAEIQRFDPGYLASNSTVQTSQVPGSSSLAPNASSVVIYPSRTETSLFLVEEGHVKHTAVQVGQRVLVQEVVQSWVRAQFELARALDEGRQDIPQRALQAWKDAAAGAIDTLSDWYYGSITDLVGHNPQQGSRKSLTLIPQGALNLLPIHALHNRAKQQFLSDEYDISYAPSLEVDERCRQRGPCDVRKALIVENPTLNLPNAEKECGEVKSVLEKEGIEVQVLRGRKATPSAFVEALQGVQLLHFCGHGGFNSNDPLDSMLMLFGPEGQQPVKLREMVTEMDLRSLQLTVLSACQTGVPELDLAEECTSIASGFILGGCRTVVCSLWNVFDDSTSELMQSFYTALVSEGLSVAESLGVAQRQLRERFQNPVYWAPFLATGDGSLHLREV